MMRKKLLILIPAVFAFFAFLLPLGMILVRSFSFPGGITNVNINASAKIVWFTFWQALVSMLLTMIVGLPGAYIFSRYQFPFRKVISSIISIPFILPTVVAAAGINALIGPRGFINLILMKLLNLTTPPIQLMNTIWIILIAHVFFNTSLVIRTVSSAWIRVDRSLEESGRILGASQLKTFWKITFPLIRPSIFSAMLLVFLFDFTSYGVILILGGPRFSTIETEIANQTLKLFNLPTAAVLSIIQIIISVAIIRLERQISRQASKGKKIKIYDENLKKPKNNWEKTMVWSIICFLLALTLLPLLSLIFRSFFVFSRETGRTGLQPGFTFVFYKQLFINERNSFFYVPPFTAIFYSIRNGVISSIISLITGLLTVYGLKVTKKGKWIESFLTLPLGTSSVTLGLGYLLLFSHYMQFPLVIPFAHSVISLPFVIRTLQPAISGIPENIHQAASVLGTKKKDFFWRVDFPIIRRPLIHAGIFAFTISMGEFGAASFLTRPETPTISVAIYRFLGQAGAMNYGQGMAMATILLFICFVSIWIIESNAG